MIRKRVKDIIDSCFQQGVEEKLWSDAAAGKYTVEVPKHENQGDFSTNFALVVAGIEKKNPREIATALGEKLEKRTELIKHLEIAGPGFVNLFIGEDVWRQLIPEVIEDPVHFGHSDIGGKKRVLVEFVSANPTGPLSIGHGRQAILGDAIGRLLEVTGHDVYREYYYNDAGRQMRVLGQSVRARYLQLSGEQAEFPEDGYQGDYIRDIAMSLVNEHGNGLRESDDIAVFTRKAEEEIFKDITATLGRLGIVFDNFYNEQSLYTDGHIDSVVEKLREEGYVYEKDEAIWFKTTEFGQEKDRVIIKSSGEPTYRLPDIAYHREKIKRGFDWMIDIFGADHIATVPDVLAGVKALGYDDSKITVLLHQFVTLTRDGKQVKMSTRKATFITVDELLDEVGVDVARFFFMMRKPDSQLEFDLDLATKESQENPVYYVQYGHARLCSILHQAKQRGLTWSTDNLSLLDQIEDVRLLKMVAAFPTLVEEAAVGLKPHRIIFFLMELAGQFHSYYNNHKVIGDDEELSRARLALVKTVLVVFRNGLEFVGLNAPEKM